VSIVVWKGRRFLEEGKRRRVREETIYHVLLNTSLHQTYIDQRISIILYDDGGARWDDTGENFPIETPVL
jgi:hypothetical protein